MGDRHDRAGVVLEKALEPGDRLGVEVVRRLVQQQQVRRLQEEPAQGDAAALAPGELRHVGVRRGQPQRVHRQLEPRIEIPRVGGIDAILDLGLLVEDLLHLLGREILAEPGVHLVVAGQQRLDGSDTLLDVLPHALARLELRLLVQKAYRDARSRKRLPQHARVLAGHDPEQRALARAVQPEHSDLRAEIERQPDVLEDLRIRRMDLPEALHGVDELRHTRIEIEDLRLKIEDLRFVT